MDFKYNKKKPIGQFCGGIYGIAMMSFIIWFFKREGFFDTGFDKWMLLPYFLFIWIMFSAIESYRKQGKTVVSLNDAGISLVDGKFQCIGIPWDEVEEITFDGPAKPRIILNPLKQYSLKSQVMRPYKIVVRSSSTIVELSEYLDGFPLIVQTLKSRFGDRFDTTNIPLDLKYPKTKNKNENMESAKQGQ